MNTDEHRWTPICKAKDKKQRFSSKNTSQIDKSIVKCMYWRLHTDYTTDAHNLNRILGREMEKIVCRD